MKQEKKGFTLIELMVVIVIIGILAAIAIPKLFGMSAKAKASEVGPAAGTWSKLLQAYILETSGVGNAISIGYTPPGATQSSNTGNSGSFNYTIEEKAGITTGTNAAEWTAKNAVPLNDCKVDNANTWNVKASLLSSAQTASYVIAIGGTTVSSTGTASGNCGVLTPNFGKLQ